MKENNAIASIQNTMTTGYSDLENLIQDQVYFVDKTKIIENLINQKDQVTLITRPRRFGKTLTMSILKNFFSIDYQNLNAPTKKAEKLFKDFYISQNKALCEKYMGQFPVISLSFNTIDGNSFKSQEGLMKAIFIELYEKFYFIMQDLNHLAENFIQINQNLSKEHKSRSNDDQNKNSQVLENETIEQFTQHIKEDFLKYIDAKTPIEEFKLALHNLIKYVSIYFNQKVILLIDEYDVPLNKALIHGYYAEMLEFIQPVMGVIKDNPYVYRSIITGCLRIAHESIFTGANNFHHYGIKDVFYSTDLGFTKEETFELLKYYKQEQSIEQVLEWYDGYIFGNTHIICPWNVIIFCQSKQSDPNIEPDSYWINTSQNAILNVLLDNLNPTIVDTLQRLVDGEQVSVQINEHLVLNKLENKKLVGDIITVDGKPKYSETAFWTILYNTGYLTRVLDQPIVRTPAGNLLTLKIPNKEVLFGFEEQIIDRFSSKSASFKQSSFDLLELFAQEPSKDLDKVIRRSLNKLLNNFISIRDGSSVDYKAHPEWYYHAFLNGMFSVILTNNNDYSDAYYRSNKELGRGYADISFKIPAIITQVYHFFD